MGGGGGGGRGGGGEGMRADCQGREKEGRRESETNKSNPIMTHTSCCRLDRSPGVAISFKILCNKR